MKVSVIIGAHNMARELPRTLASLSPKMQRDISSEDYEIIVVDNGSETPIDLAQSAFHGVNLKYVRVSPETALQSPVRALNTGLQEARGAIVGIMIDGARMASPGIIAGALRADLLSDRTITLTLGFHLGPKVQMESVREGYDQAYEDRLLDAAGWSEDGYRLFEVSTFAASSRSGWFHPVAESNALFMRRTLWDELGGFDERFDAPGGGLANLDLLERAVKMPGALVVTLLGEATFHQVHGGVATNSPEPAIAVFREEYRRIRGKPYQPPSYRFLLLGELPPQAHRHCRERPML